MKHTTPQNTDLSPDAALFGDGTPFPSGALLPASLFVDCIKGLFLLDSELRDVICLRILGITYREIGERLGISTQLAEMRHRRAMREWPSFEAFFPNKVAKRHRRKGRV